MPLRDTATQPFHDLLSAFGLLSRLPMPRTERHRAQAAWAWPLVGLGIGSLAALTALVSMRLGLPAGIAAALAMALAALTTGALHEDGLADTFDGLFGGWTTERRLEIMKDSHIGSYGTLALIFGSLIRWQALTHLIDLGRIDGIIAVAALSRAPMAVLMTALPNARRSGLSQHVGKPGWVAAGLAVFLAIGIAVSLLGALALWLGGIAAVIAGGVGLVAWRRIGGQTGDILGASQQLTELGALCGMIALLAA